MLCAWLRSSPQSLTRLQPGHCCRCCCHLVSCLEGAPGQIIQLWSENTHKYLTLDLHHGAATDAGVNLSASSIHHCRPSHRQRWKGDIVKHSRYVYHGVDPRCGNVTTHSTKSWRPLSGRRSAQAKSYFQSIFVSLESWSTFSFSYLILQASFFQSENLPLTKDTDPLL